jgi:hypothetical protein
MMRSNLVAPPPASRLTGRAIRIAAVLAAFGGGFLSGEGSAQVYGNSPPRPPADVPGSAFPPQPPPVGYPSQYPSADYPTQNQAPPQYQRPYVASPPSGIQAQPLPPPPGATAAPAAPPAAANQRGRAATAAPGAPQPANPPPPQPADTAPQPDDTVVTEMPTQKIENNRAVFSGLDKITGRIISFDAAVGETVQFGALRVTARVCYTRPPTEATNTDAFVEIDEVTLQGEIKRIFNGWMFAASPGLHAVEHPIYDVWLSDCSSPLPARIAEPAVAPTPAAVAPGTRPPSTPRQRQQTGARQPAAQAPQAPPLQPH